MNYQKQIFNPIKCLKNRNNENRIYDVGNPSIFQHSHDNIIAWNANENQFIDIQRETCEAVIPNSQDKQIVLSDKKAFINLIISRCIDMYDKKTENHLYIRKMLLTYYPGVLRYFNKLYPDKRDVIKGIEEALRKAISFYNSSEKIKQKEINTQCVENAFNYLKNNMYTELPGFNEAWEMLTNLYQLT